MSNNAKEQIQEILDRERWQGYVIGMVDGALDVLQLLDCDREKKLDLLSSAIGLSHATADDFLSGREGTDEQIDQAISNAEEEFERTGESADADTVFSELEKRYNGQKVSDDTRIEHFAEDLTFGGLSVRTTHYLISAGITTIGELKCYTWSDLRDLPKFGHKCMGELRAKTEAAGIEIRENARGNLGNPANDERVEAVFHYNQKIVKLLHELGFTVIGELRENHGEFLKNDRISDNEALMLITAMTAHNIPVSSWKENPY